MRKFLVSKMIKLAQWLTTSDKVSNQLGQIEGQATMDEILLTGNWGS